MPEIQITDTQQKRLEEVREDVESAFVDTYGHTTLEDAFEYLLDTYTHPEELDGPATDAYEQIATAEYPTLQRIAADIPEVPGSGIDADTMRGKLLRELGAEEFAARLQDAGEDGVETDDSPEEDSSVDDEAAESVSDDEGQSDGEEQQKETDEADDLTVPTFDEDNGETEESASESQSETDDSPGGILSTANRLLDEHDDKWHDNESGDEPYVVDLPDGDTETVRTKDDVRQLLFRHY